MINTKTGVELIAEERKRQIEVEGWTARHDAEHSQGEMMEAAGCYVAHALSKLREDLRHTNQSPLAKFQVYDFGELILRKAGWKDGWPWDRKWWKPSDKIKDLIKAGALIAAEIDRLNVVKYDPSTPPPGESEGGEAPIHLKEISDDLLYTILRGYNAIGLPEKLGLGYKGWRHGALFMYHRDQSTITALQKERDAYKDKWERAQKDIAALTEQIKAQ